MNENKMERKRKRFAARLKRKGIICCDTPGLNIVLCNVGQASGFDKAQLLNLLDDYALDVCPPKYISEKGESHSFVVFQTTDDASTFYKKMNGKEVDRKGTVLFMSFVDNVSETEEVYFHENPRGLTIINDFINEGEEELFIKLFDWAPETDSGNLKNHQVKHYGYEFRYGSNDVDLDNPLPEKIPSQCDILWERLKQHGFDLGVPNQLTVNKYSPGQGIPLHVDRHSPFGPDILSLSLCSSVLMDWKHHSGVHVPVPVPQRSILIMQDEARYDWQHGIQPRAWDPVLEQRSVGGRAARVAGGAAAARRSRVSLTFRWARRGACACTFPRLCDSRGDELHEEELGEDAARRLEDLHVHRVYDEIASHFSSTRHRAWPRAAAFLAAAAPGDVVLDLGAGNGKNIAPRNDVLQLAGERCGALAAACAARGAAAVRLCALAPPLRRAAADRLLCAAVLHHFTTPARRLKAVSVIYDLLRPGGLAFITVWARDQSGASYLRRGAAAPGERAAAPGERAAAAGVWLPVHRSREQFQHADVLVPWRLPAGAAPLLRYYHVFERDELDRLCRDVGFEVQHSFYEEGNWCVQCRKP